ncbi:MAG TPA: LLM class flavin-dependent oxidoreductase [Stellaceae bacterium]
MKAWPKPVQKPHPPVIVGGAFPHAARRAVRYGYGWIPHAGRPQYSDVTDFMPQFQEMMVAAERRLDEVPITVFGVPKDLERLQRYRDRGIARVVVSLLSATAAEILPILELIRRTQ